MRIFPVMEKFSFPVGLFLELLPDRDLLYPITIELVHERVDVSFTNCSDMRIAKYDVFVIALRKCKRQPIGFR